MEEGLNSRKELKDMAASFSPLVLAYMGDAVYELMIRARVVQEGNRQVSKLHHAAIHFVKADTQAKIVRHLEPELTAEERAVFRRGRNAHSNTSAKNASIVDYRVATGFEALVGWLWLTGKEERLKELVDSALDWLAGEERKEREMRLKLEAGPGAAVQTEGPEEQTGTVPAGDRGEQKEAVQTERPEEQKKAGQDEGPGKEQG